MKNTMGSALTVTLFGESHGPALGAVLDGISPGIKVDTKYINEKMNQRKPKGDISTKRQETDAVEILSGVFNGYTTGTPLSIIIRNEDAKSKDYDVMSQLARPSHGDLTGFYKYGGFEDFRGGGHFSGRITAALVAVGAIVMKALEDKGIYIGTHIKNCYGIEDRTFDKYDDDIKNLANLGFPALDEAKSAQMQEEILKAFEEGDSVGGILETAVIGLPCGVGEPWFDTVEGMIAHAIFSVPAVKGIEFGAGFGITSMKGSEANDPLRYVDGKIVSKSNNSGGINGGITNGMPVVFRTAIKPTPSIFKNQETVNFRKGENAELKIIGRHDPAIVHRARAVVDAVTALTIGDLLTVHFGTDFLRS